MRGVYESGAHAPVVQPDDRAGEGQGTRGAERAGPPLRSAQGGLRCALDRLKGDGGDGGGFTSNRHLLSLLFGFAVFHRAFLALTRHWHWEPARRDQSGVVHATMRWIWPLELWCARVLGVTQSYEFTEDLDVDKRYVFAVRHHLPYTATRLVNSPRPPRLSQVSPHGAFATSWVLFLLPLVRFNPEFIRLNLVVGAASVLFNIPVLREFLLFYSCRPANRSTLHRLAKDGHSIALIPGGIWEQVNTDMDGPETVYVQANLGFIRLAMAHGLDLVPIYGFGENQVSVRPAATRCAAAGPAVAQAFNRF